MTLFSALKHLSNKSYCFKEFSVTLPKLLNEYLGAAMEYTLTKESASLFESIKLMEKKQKQIEKANQKMIETKKDS